MSEQIKIQDFSAGWIPSDSAHGGRKNGLLKMTGLTLDENGALTLSQGTKKGPYAYPANAHTLFSTFVCDTFNNYLGLVDGSLFRNSTKIIEIGAGSTSRAAFGVYGDFILIFSGATRIKDGCDGVVELAGIVEPDLDLIINLLTSISVSGAQILGDFANWVHNWNGFGGSFTVISDSEFSVDLTNASTDANYSWDTNAGAPDFPKDLSGTDEDVFSFKVFCNRLTDVEWITVSFWLDYNIASNLSTLVTGLGATNYFTHTWSQEEILAASSGNSAILSCKRSDFERSIPSTIGTSWESIQGINIGIKVPLSVVDAVADYSNFMFTDGGNVNGSYEYVQVNVYKSSNYLAYSSLGPISPLVQVVNGTVEIIPQDPTLLDSSVNEIWIFRRGGLLDKFYRVGIIPYYALGPLYDTFTDQDLLTLNQFYVPLLTLNSDDLPEDILEVVGPVHGRMLYFSATKLYFSEIYSPENYNPANVLTIAGDEAEKFLFAKKTAENVVIIGTTRELYILTGTFQSFPDGSLDVQLRSLGVDKPPICRDVVLHKNTLIYFAPEGWIEIDISGNYNYLTFPNTDVLYSGRSRYDYSGVPTAAYSNTGYPVGISQDKLFCVVPVIDDYTDPHNPELWLKRMEVYDLNKKYWRPYNYTPDLISVGDDGRIMGFFNSTKRLNQINYPFTKLLNKA